METRSIYSIILLFLLGVFIFLPFSTCEKLNQILSSEYLHGSISEKDKDISNRGRILTSHENINIYLSSESNKVRISISSILSFCIFSFRSGFG